MESKSGQSPEREIVHKERWRQNAHLINSFDQRKGSSADQKEAGVDLFLIQFLLYAFCLFICFIKFFRKVWRMQIDKGFHKQSISLIIQRSDGKGRIPTGKQPCTYSLLNQTVQSGPKSSTFHSLLVRNRHTIYILFSLLSYFVLVDAIFFNTFFSVRRFMLLWSLFVCLIWLLKLLALNFHNSSLPSCSYYKQTQIFFFFCGVEGDFE